MSESPTIDLLRALIPLDALNLEHLRNLERRLHIEHIPAGHVLFIPGDVDHRHIYLLSGEVELSDGDGPRRLIRGGTAEARRALAHRQPRQATARAATAVDILRVDSRLLDIMLTWDQAGNYQVHELETSHEEDADWMTRMLQTEAFHRIPPANIQAIFMRMEPVRFRRGEAVIRQGEEGDFFYIVKEGRCLVTRESPDTAGAIKLAELGAGESFGEDSLIADIRRTASVIMLTDGSLMRLAKQDFINLLNEPVLNWVDFEEAARRVTSNQACWLDVRLPSEHENRHIRDSKNVPLSGLRAKLGTLDPSVPLIVYCDTGRRSSAAAFLLTEYGFDVCVLKDGLSSVPTAETEGTD